MCTVAFVPTARGGYLLAHNRDERRSRPRGLPPRRFLRDKIAVLAPRDPEGGGTWIAVNACGITLCILNAEEKNPGRLPEQPRSRGLIVWDHLAARSLNELRSRFHPAVGDLSDVRAFHVVAVEPGSSRRPARVARVRWDGVQVRWDDRETAALFVSSGVDPQGALHDRRASWGRLLRARSQPDVESLSNWMTSHEPKRGATSVCVHRRGVATVCRTIISADGANIAMHYKAGPPCDPSASESRHRFA